MREPTVAEPTRTPTPLPARGFAAGCVGGLVATVALTAFQQATVAVAKQWQGHVPRSGRSPSSGPIDQAKLVDGVLDNTARAIAGGLFGTVPGKVGRTAIGMAAHVAFGTVVGGLYGWLAEVWPTVTVGRGTGYGTAVWLGADEMAVPGLGLARSPARNPPPMHAAAWSVHLVYGVVLEAVRRAVVGPPAPRQTAAASGT